MTKTKKILLIVCFLLLLAYVVSSFSKYGAPSEFGNETATTVFLGGDFGIVNASGDIIGNRFCNASNACFTLSELNASGGGSGADLNCNSTGSCSGGNVSYMNFPNTGNFNISGNHSASEYLNGSNDLEWIGPENIKDVDLEDICLPGEVCPFVRITGDVVDVLNVTNQALLATTSENVGIRSLSPQYLLQVGNVSKAVNLSDILFIDGTTGFVGIGTSTPNQKLHVIGNINATGNASVSILKGDGAILDKNLLMKNSNITNISDIFIGINERDHCIYFYEEGSPTGESFCWDDGADRFEVSDSFFVSGTLSTTVVTASSLIQSQGDISTTGAGDDLWLGVAVQRNALFQAYADGSFNISGGNFTVDTFGNLNTTRNIQIGGCILYNCSQPTGCATLGVCV